MHFEIGQLKHHTLKVHVVAPFVAFIVTETLLVCLGSAKEMQR